MFADLEKAKLKHSTIPYKHAISYLTVIPVRSQRDGFVYQSP